METLQEIMKKLLADSFALYLKAHNYHWNVEGPLFSQYHDFFAKIYGEVYGSIDDTAEEIRALDSYAPGSFSRFSELTDIEDEVTIPSPVMMCSRLYEDNQKVIQTLDIAFKLASQFDKQGLADFLAGRIDIHNKHAWMLKSIMK
jgi:starvation-inducible DNA-binding protein